MKLGIAVVYLFGDENAPLLDVHLSQIERHTTVPYTIYGSVNRLDPRYRRRLEHAPRVRICDVPDTGLRGGAEHAHYLDHLIKAAIDDGASHVVTMHLDSFPIRSGWAEELAATLSGTCVFATLQNIQTACFFFHREFYLQHRPALWPLVQPGMARRYREYVRTERPDQHSGTGYGFTAYANGLRWYYLRPTSHDPYASDYPLIWDNIMFHLGATVGAGERRSRPERLLATLGAQRCLDVVSGGYRLVLPRATRQWLRRLAAQPLNYLVDQPRRNATLARMAVGRRRQELLQDPDAYLRRITIQGSRDIH